MTPLKLILRDIDRRLVDAWKLAFIASPEVEVGYGDIFDRTADAIVSPANSFGFMDGGIDAVYSRRFGWDLQERLQALLRSEHDGECPVGSAVLIETRDANIPLCISAPTMRVPGRVADTANAYLAMRAALRLARAHPTIRSVLCPGLATAVGQMPRERAALQMAEAYAVVVLGQTPAPKTWPESMRLHERLLA